MLPNLFPATRGICGHSSGISVASTAPCSTLRALLTVRVSQINHCWFCIDLNSATWPSRGASEEKVQALARWREQRDVFTERERVALEYAEAITFTDRKVDDALLARVKQYFDDATIVELTGLVAFQNLSSKFNAALDIPSQGLCAATPRPG